MDCLICKAPCRARPTHRPNLRLSHPQQMGGVPFWPTALMLLGLGALPIVAIWARTCGLGVAC